MSDDISRILFLAGRLDEDWHDPVGGGPKPSFESRRTALYTQLDEKLANIPSIERAQVVDIVLQIERLNAIYKNGND